MTKLAVSHNINITILTETKFNTETWTLRPKIHVHDDEEKKDKIILSMDLSSTATYFVSSTYKGTLNNERFFTTVRWCSNPEVCKRGKD